MLKWSLYDSQTAHAAAYCDKCRQEVYHGEARYRWEGQWLCPECFREAIDRTSLAQLALELRLDTETV